ncbi:hypothetical protein HZS_1650 [Henneguya salminicola]|nr:hypothetical protein HZS_1650 [Henneguya salminicola]
MFYWSIFSRENCQLIIFCNTIEKYFTFVLLLPDQESYNMNNVFLQITLLILCVIFILPSKLISIFHII